MEQIINDLRSGLQKTWLSGDALEQTLAHTVESLERLAFGRILSEQLSEKELDIYREILEIDEEIDGYGFLKGIRPNEVDSLITNAFKYEVTQFLQTL